VVLAGRGGGDDRPTPAPGFSPAAAPSRTGPPPWARDEGPRTFAAPEHLDGRSAKDWRKVADKIRKGEYDDALDKLHEFERKHSPSRESAALREWLEQRAD
ncbi:MAG: hypothetical protein K8M05_39885, partial [Deltaproteobacteria bacterium]|nr:hypothetical protein [Kofleriaceae bacterium]